MGRGKPRERYGPREQVPAGPFLEWFDGYCRRTGLGRKTAAVRLGINEKQVIRSNEEISVLAVDKALLYEAANIRDLYPELFDV
jgi:hypothetical protein